MEIEKRGEIEIWKFQRELREKKATVGRRRKIKKGGGAEIEKRGGNGDLEISTRTETEVSNSWKKKKKRKKKTSKVGQVEILRGKSRPLLGQR